ncbi:hypothetical protein SZ64_09350 [Erythrobacter sp. SG61-1L]|nr:hypothetical protein SZ64_09350 [Erythrobacter sp. SG61-1L]
MRFEALPSPNPELEKPCQVCVSHQPNTDGYLHKTWTVEGRKLKEPFHRFILRAHRGWEQWPEGLECDHLCRHRLCAEPSHLRPLERSEHKSVTNATRYSERHKDARDYWLATGCTGTALGERFNVSYSSGCRWIRQWKADLLA